MYITSWGNYPIIDSQILKFNTPAQLKAHIQANQDLIPRGNGRSYGDSALGKHIIPIKNHHLLLDFDAHKGQDRKSVV